MPVLCLSAVLFKQHTDIVCIVILRLERRSVFLCGRFRIVIGDGRYEGEPIKAVIAPGATVALRKVDFVKLMCRPEYSFTAKNGKVRPGGGKRQNGVMTLEDQLSAYTFAFDDGSSVNDFRQLSLFR